MNEYMTVKEVSEFLNVTDKHIRETIKKIMPDRMQHGVTTQLNEVEVTAIKLYVERNPHLNHPVGVKTKLEKNLIVMQAMSILQEDNETLLLENAEMRPKAVSYDTFMSSDNLHGVNEVAKMLGTGQKRLFALLREENIFFKKNNLNFPYQQFIDNGCFEVKQFVIPTGQAKAVIKVTAKGVVFIEKMINKNTI